jgi:hypothetical protein
MKRWIIAVCFVVILSGCETDNDVTPQIETRLNDYVVEYKYTHEEIWKILVDFSSLIDTKELAFEIFTNAEGDTILTYGGDQIILEKSEIISVTNIILDEINNEVYALYSDGSSDLIGTINMPQFISGDDGIGISEIYLTEVGHLEILLSDGKIVDVGKIVGKNGLDGQNGLDGRGVIDIEIDPQGNCYITYSDLTKVNIGPIVGRDGQDGDDGLDGVKGDTAYELYVKYHPSYTKTEKEWVDDLVLGKLSSADYYDVLTLEDWMYALTNDDVVAVKLQHDINLIDPYLITKEMTIDLNGYQITGDIMIQSNKEQMVELSNGTIIGDVTIESPNASFDVQVNIKGSLYIKEMMSSVNVNHLIDNGVFIEGGGQFYFDKGLKFNVFAFSDEPVYLEGNFSNISLKSNSDIRLATDSTVDIFDGNDSLNSVVYVTYGSTINTFINTENIIILEEVCLNIFYSDQGRVSVFQKGVEITPVVDKSYIVLANEKVSLNIHNKGYQFIEETLFLSEDQIYYTDYQSNNTFTELINSTGNRVSIEGILFSIYDDMYLIETDEGVVYIPIETLNNVSFGNYLSIVGVAEYIENRVILTSIEKFYLIESPSINDSIYMSTQPYDEYLYKRVSIGEMVIEEVVAKDDMTTYYIRDMIGLESFSIDLLTSQYSFNIGDVLYIEDVILIPSIEGFVLDVHSITRIQSIEPLTQNLNNYFDYITNQIIPNVVIEDIVITNQIIVQNIEYAISFNSSDYSIIDDMGHIKTNGFVDVTLTFVNDETSFSFAKTVEVDISINTVTSAKLLEDAVYLKGSYVHIEIALNWNDASEIIHIEYLEDFLLLNEEYFIEDNLVIIDAYYLQNIDIEHLEECQFILTFDHGDALLVNVVFE